jgi:hypothetical protein
MVEMIAIKKRSAKTVQTNRVYAAAMKTACPMKAAWHGLRGDRLRQGENHRQYGRCLPNPDAAYVFHCACSISSSRGAAGAGDMKPRPALSSHGRVNSFSSPGRPVFGDGGARA